MTKIPYTHYIIEGVDGLGKSTLIQEIKNQNGFYHYLHYEKPQKLEYYENHLLSYQVDSFQYGFELLEQHVVPFIFDRFHLGEVVYSQPYRRYPGDYVFSFERDYNVQRWEHVKLILLVTSNWSHIQDDGQSFDFSAKETEQEQFISTFNQSIFRNKQIIDICTENGTRKTPQELFKEIS